MIEEPEQGGREEDGTDCSTSTGSAVSSKRQLSLSSAVSGDPVTREWEEVPCKDLIREIFDTDKLRPTSSSSEDDRAVSTASPLAMLTRLLWRRRRQLRQQHSRQAPQPSPLASSPVLEPPAQDDQPAPDPSQPSNQDLRGHAIDTLVLLVHKDVEAMARDTEDEVNALLSLQAVLRRRAEEIGFTLRPFEEEKEGLELKLRRVQENVHALKEWGRENGNRRAPEGGEVDVDGVFVARDGLSAELLRWQSADWAIDDVDSALEKMVRKGALPFRVYLENVYALAARQFVIRASRIMLAAAQVMLVREVEMDEEMGQLAL